MSLEKCRCPMSLLIGYADDDDDDDSLLTVVRIKTH